MQDPFDLLAIQDLIYTQRPDLIIETGTANGGAPPSAAASNRCTACRVVQPAQAAPRRCARARLRRPGPLLPARHGAVSSLLWASLLEMMGLEGTKIITIDLNDPAQGFGGDGARDVTQKPLWKKYVTFLKVRIRMVLHRYGGASASMPSGSRAARRQPGNRPAPKAASDPSLPGLRRGCPPTNMFWMRCPKRPARPAPSLCCSTRTIRRQARGVRLPGARPASPF